MDNQLAAIIVHDIKNALGMLESELRVMTQDPTSERAVAAHEACVGMRDKLIGFLTLYKASSQGLHANVDAVSPEDFLNGMLRHRTSTRSDLRIELDTSAMPPYAYFDENLVELALDAALQNASRFARSTVTLGCRQIDDDLVFSVSDDGPGLGTAEAKPSTGLGMELCSAIAQAHKKSGRCGSVSLQNGAHGGAVFSMRLP
jgi:signal transduction histidine kinase